MLARLRYNRLIDTFTKITCYALQSHLGTTVRSIQMETDDVYVGVDRRGAHYVLPIQAKGHRDRLSEIQIEQDVGMCEEKFPNLVCRPIGAQFLADGAIALFEFEKTDGGEIAILRERHYRLAPPDEMTTENPGSHRRREP